MNGNDMLNILQEFGMRLRNTSDRRAPARVWRAAEQHDARDLPPPLTLAPDDNLPLARGGDGPLLTAAAATPPQVTMRPHPQHVRAGATVTFTAVASGTPPPAVQWQVSAGGGKTFVAIPDATGNSLSFTATADQNGYKYRAVFTNAAGILITRAAALTVEPYLVSAPANPSEANDR